MKVSIIGMGPGTKDYLLPAAQREIARADCLVGSRRHVALFQELGKETHCIEGRFSEIVPFIKKYKSTKKIAVLVSGDPGMYSLLDQVSQALKPEEYRVIPGVSTVQLAFAKIGESWEDARVLSLHGRKVNNLSLQIRSSGKTFLFTDSTFPPSAIAAQLLKEGLDNRKAFVFENLSYPDERVLKTNLKRLSRMEQNAARLSAMIVMGAESCGAEKGVLYGLGIGPGDPRLMTLRAKEILDQVDVVFVPKGSEDGTSLARSIVEGVTTRDKTFVELTFPMTKDQAVLARYWEKAAGIVANTVREKKKAAFVTLGDPSIYSTYLYLLKMMRRHYPSIHIETVPGISSFNAAAASMDSALVEGGERMAVVPVTDQLAGVREALENFDTVVLMKVGSKLESVTRLLKELNLLGCATLVSRVGHKDERIARSLASLRNQKIGYLSVIIVKKNRT